MANSDITLHKSRYGFPGSDNYQVEAGATTINPGEPVAKALASRYVTAMATNKPVVATDYLAGISMSTSTQTAGADGGVDVMFIDKSLVFLISPKVAATWDTQTEYDALVGKRVLIDLTGGSYTILAADGATYGCVIQPLDINKYPGKVAFSFRDGVNYLT
jgi:hypothetical protein